MGQSAERVATARAWERDLADLLGRTAQGDQSALGALYDETSPLVYGLARRILRDRLAAEEVTIEVYVQVYRQAARYDPGRGSASSWLLMLTRSRAIDRLRAEAQRRSRETSLETTEPIASSDADPQAASVAAERRRAVRTALASLTPEQRQVIEIAYYSGLSHSEIAAKLALPLGTVKTRIRTGMMLLRDRLGPVGAEEQP